MKNTNLKLNKTKLVARLMIVILLLTSALTLASCGNKGLEVGMFKYGEFMPEFMCGYKSNINQFYINDVTLDFYYGIVHPNYEIESFELYFIDESEEMHLIKKVNESLAQEKYRIEYKHVPFLMRFFVDNLKYNYSEKITIPKELFAQEEGYLMFALTTETMYGGEDTGCRACSHQCKTHTLSRQILYYKVDGNSVTIYSE